MAQSDNGNDTGNQDSASQNSGKAQSGAAGVEDLLATLIDHVESSGSNVSEAPVEDTRQQQAAQAQSLVDQGAEEAVEGTETPPEKGAGIPAIGSVRHGDFEDIEKRAANLASKLGRTGLSFGKKARSRLEQVMSDNQQDEDAAYPAPDVSLNKPPEPDENAVPSAELVEDDRLMEERIEEHLEMRKDKVFEQAQHVQDWHLDAAQERTDDAVVDDQGDDAVLHDAIVPMEPKAGGEDNEAGLSKDQLEAARRAAEVAATQFVDLDSLGVSRPLIEADAGQSDSAKPTLDDTDKYAVEPELEDIEAQISSLSRSIEDAETQSGGEDAQEALFDTQPGPLAEAPQTGADPALHTRVSSLEKQIVELMDRVTISEQEIAATIADVTREETGRAVEDGLQKSDFISGMKGDLKQAADDRHAFEGKMSDSLDALHDALKDLGDRVAGLETNGYEGTSDAVAGGAHKAAIAGGIASSVLQTQLPGDNAGTTENLLSSELMDSAGTDNTEPQADDQNAQELAENETLPAWLDDHTGDLVDPEVALQEPTPDIFAPVAENKAETGEEQAYPENAPLPDLSIQDEVRDAKEDLPGVVEADTPGSAPFKTEDNQSEGHDFLHSARAAALAANERARQETDAFEQGMNNNRILSRLGSHDEGGMEKNESETVSRNEAPVTSSNKKSLFDNKVEGPNLLLVITTLVLFGTSALLLWGMNVNKDKQGSVSGLKAVEQPKTETADQINAAGQKKNSGPSGAVPGGQVTPKGRKTGGETKKTPPAIEKRSDLDASKGEPWNAGVRVADLFGGPKESGDTLTSGDRDIPSKSEPQTTASTTPVDVTAALPDRIAKTKAGSLFDQYVGFSNGAKGTAKPKAAHAVASKTGLKSSRRETDYAKARRLASLDVKDAKSRAQAVALYKKSAKAGYAPAIYRLATHYERGKGVKKDYEKALELYVKAAKMGNINAMHNLAVLYTGGDLGKSDYARAVIWYTKAALYGVKDSQFNLGIIYQNGLGAPIDQAKAYKWYTLAARAGDEEARTIADRLRAQLSTDKRRAMDLQLHNWQAQTPALEANERREHRQL